MLCARVCIIIISAASLVAANWEQLFGPELQNVVTQGYTPWTPRYGAAAAVLPRTAQPGETDVPDTELERMFLLGGDDFVIGQGGGLHNDVWYTTGESASLKAVCVCVCVCVRDRVCA